MRRPRAQMNRKHDSLEFAIILDLAKVDLGSSRSQTSTTYLGILDSHSICGLLASSFRLRVSSERTMGKTLHKSLAAQFTREVV